MKLPDVILQVFVPIELPVEDHPEVLGRVLIASSFFPANKGGVKVGTLCFLINTTNSVLSGFTGLTHEYYSCTEIFKACTSIRVKSKRKRMNLERERRSESGERNTINIYADVF